MVSSVRTACVPLCLSALQSPIEYQRRESKSNSLGRSMRPPLSAASALRPHSSASIDRHKLPSLHSHNTSLPALYLPSQGQGVGSSETYSLRDVGVLWRQKMLLCVCVQRAELLAVCVCSRLWSSCTPLTPTRGLPHTSNWASLTSQTVKRCQTGCTHPPNRLHRWSIWTHFGGLWVDELWFGAVLQSSYITSVLRKNPAETDHRKVNAGEITGHRTIPQNNTSFVHNDDLKQSFNKL